MTVQPPYPGSTRFYVGRGPEAREVGVTTDNFDPLYYAHHFRSTTAREYTQEMFERFASGASGNSLNRDRDTAAPTQWIMAYDKGSIYVYFDSIEMAVLRCNLRRWVRGDIAAQGGDRDQEEFVPRRPTEFPPPLQSTPRKVSTA